MSGSIAHEINRSLFTVILIYRLCVPYLSKFWKDARNELPIKDKRRRICRNLENSNLERSRYLRNHPEDPVRMMEDLAARNVDVICADYDKRVTALEMGANGGENANAVIGHELEEQKAELMSVSQHDDMSSAAAPLALLHCAASLAKPLPTSAPASSTNAIIATPHITPTKTAYTEAARTAGNDETSTKKKSRGDDAALLVEEHRMWKRRRGKMGTELLRSGADAESPFAQFALNQLSALVVPVK